MSGVGAFAFNLAWQAFGVGLDKKFIKRLRVDKKKDLHIIHKKIILKYRVWYWWIYHSPHIHTRNFYN